MRRALVILLLLLAAVPALAQGRYVDAEAGFSLAVPEGWNGSKDQPGVLISLWPADRSSAFSVQRADAQGASAAQIEEDLTRAAAAKGYKVLRRWKRTVAGQPAVSMVYQSPRGFEANTVVVLGNEAFILQAAAKDRKAFQAATPAFEMLTSSFQPVADAGTMDRAARVRAQERQEYLRQERLRQERLRRERIERERR